METATVYILVFLTTSLAKGTYTVVNTPLGDIYGTEIEFEGCRVQQYLGIRYAEPPTGDLRFKKPVPAKKYSGTVMATRMPPACPQHSKDPYPWYSGGRDQSEDCLFLNIWVPACSTYDPPGDKSVMFWIHGGGFMLGSIRDNYYNATVLCAYGDVIIVTVNYRLGALGFFTTSTDDAPPNRGLYDILVALKWVRSNIGYFGGDKDSITLFGESVGSVAVSIFSVSPLFKGLYKKIILESGTVVSPIIVLAATVNFVFGQRLALSLGCTDSLLLTPQGVVDCMRNKTAEAIVFKTDYLLPHTSVIFLPQIGDAMIPKDPRSSVFSERFQDSDVMICNNNDEGSLFLTTTFSEIFGFFGNSSSILSIESPTTMKEMPKGFNMENIGSLLLSPLNFVIDYVRYKIYTLLGDALFVCPNVYFGEKFAAAGNNVYFGVFDHRPSTTPWAPWMGVAHFEEIKFVFGNPILYPQNYTDQERQLSKWMIKMWSNFAKTGKPDSRWPKYSRANPAFRYLNLTSLNRAKYGSGFHQLNCELLRLIYTIGV